MEPGQQQKPYYSGGWWPVATLDLTQPVETKTKEWGQEIGTTRKSTLPSGANRLQISHLPPEKET